MRLWQLTRTDAGGRIYDCYDGYIIRAPSEERARQIANEHPADEGPVWTDPTKVTCECIGDSLDGSGEAVIMTDFHAG